MNEEEEPKPKPTALTREHATKVLRSALLPFGPMLVAVLVLLAIGPSDASLGYYEAIAQILPLLLLVLVLEHRYFFRRFPIPPTRRQLSPAAQRRWSKFDTLAFRGYPLLLLAILGGGEWAALDALAFEDPNPNLFQVTVAALAGGFTAICLLAAIGEPRQDS